MSNYSLPIRNRHIAALDGMRGVAVLAVFLFHYGGGSKSHSAVARAIAEGLHLGWVGVSLFFVLSGFLITGILWDSFNATNWWSRFYIRRSLRIFPLYYLAVLLALGFAALYGFGRQSLHTVWVYLLYLQNIPVLPREAKFSPILPVYHFWSLAVEEQFYFVWPVLLWLMPNRQRAKALCVLIFLLSLAFRVAIAWHGSEESWASEFLAGRMGELSAGAWLAISLRGPDQEVQRVFQAALYLLPITGAAVLSLVLLRGTVDLSDRWMVTAGLALMSFFFGSLLVRAMSGGVIDRCFRMAWLRWLGKVSYGVYVYHILLRPLFDWIGQRLFPTAGFAASRAITAVVALVGTLAASTASFYLFESSFLRLQTRLAPKTLDAEQPQPARGGRNQRSRDDSS